MAMLFFTGLSLLLALVYTALMLTYWQAWRKMPEQVLPANFQPRASLTVIIPARNEATNIGSCLRSILANDYPAHLLEIIVVDDFSEDATAEVVDRAIEKLKMGNGKADRPRLRLLRLANFVVPGETLAYKKRAIEIAVSQARGEIIVTTDADCLVGKTWLRQLSAALQGPAVNPPCQAVTGPVCFYEERNLLQRFQSLDFLGMMGITGAGHALDWHRLGNGANLAYRKAAFQEVGGYAGTDGRASGDDVLLLQKLAERYPTGLAFLKNRAAVVLTTAPATWRDFLQQRLRWGTKNAASPDRGMKVALGGVFLFCWSIVLSLFLLPFFCCPLFLPLCLLVFKALCDWIFLREMCRFFRREDLLRCFVPAFFLHIFYIVGVGTASLFWKEYRWKGRRVR